MAERFHQGWGLAEGIQASVASLSGSSRKLRADDLEVAVLEHGPERRTFRRIGGQELVGLLGDDEPSEKGEPEAKPKSAPDKGKDQAQDPPRDAS
jgi:hypothetical protein